MSGWICLHRSLLDHWTADDPGHFAAWVKVLMSVNWKAGSSCIKGKLMEVSPGQSVRSYQTWAKLFGWSRSKTVRFFKLLEKSECVRIENETVTIRLTIVNWGTYQTRIDEGGTVTDSEPERIRNGGGTHPESIEQGNTGTIKQETQIAAAAASGDRIKEGEQVTDPDDIPVGQSQIAELHAAMDAVTEEAAKSTGSDEDKGANPKHDGFKKAWDRYAYKDKKKTALSAWAKLSRADKLAAYHAMPFYVAVTHPTGEGGKTLRALFASWVNARRWEDESITRAMALAKSPQESGPKRNANGIIESTL